MHTPIVITRARALALALVGIAAKANVAVAAEPIDPVTLVPAAKVEAAFATGMPLIETNHYKIHASRREAPGMAEVHVTDTDIIYVLEGSATIVTGGTIDDGKTIAAGEIRGAAIRGGVERVLSKGDVLVVPSNVPHWFTKVSKPFLYYVVKATDGGVR